MGRHHITLLKNVIYTHFNFIDIIYDSTNKISSVHGVELVQQHIQALAHILTPRAPDTSKSHITENCAHITYQRPPRPIHQMKALVMLRMEHVAISCDSTPSLNEIVAKFDLVNTCDRWRKGSEVCGR